MQRHGHRPERGTQPLNEADLFRAYRNMPAKAPEKLVFPTRCIVGSCPTMIWDGRVVCHFHQKRSG
jgi:hypothetical protein